MNLFWGENYPTTTGFSVPKTGISIEHDEVFTIDRPEGWEQDYLFLCFTSAISLRDQSGVATRRAGACIVYQPMAYQWYRGAGKGFTHHFMHFRGPATDTILADLRIPLNTVLYPADTSFAEDAMLPVLNELSRREHGWDRMVARHAELLLLNLHRRLRAAGSAPPGRYSDTTGRLQALRESIVRNPEQEWTLERMARLAALSYSRLSVAYRRAFGVSPVNDVIDLRMQRAKWLLLHEDLSVKEVCGAVGIDDPAYFSRLFKKRVGVGPQFYRRRHAAGS